MRIDLDMPVSCVDGAFGDLADVVIDPGARGVTHVVVRPNDRGQRARLAPIGSAGRSDGAEAMSLDCTIAAILESDPIQESAYVRTGELVAGGSDWDVGIQEVYALSDYGSLGPEVMGSGFAMEYDQHVAVSYHRVPKGGVEIRRGSQVTSSDERHLGHVAGFDVADNGTITSLILEHGHLWGQRMVLIPGDAIARFEVDELELSMTEDEVAALKPLPAHHWWSPAS